MKTRFFYVFMVLCIIFFSACSSNDDAIANDNSTIGNTVTNTVQSNLVGYTKVDIPNDINEVAIYNWVDESFLGNTPVVNGHIWIGSSNASMTVKLYNAKSNSAKTRASIDELGLGYIKDATIYKSQDNVISIQKAENAESGFNGNDFLAIFPPGKDNRNISAPANVTNFQHNVLYVSNGLPFAVYPIYSCGWYDLTLGIFYYDANGEKHEVSFWDMLTVHWKTPYDELVRNNARNANSFTISKTSNAEGYQITLPENYAYGFYVTSPQGGKFYCYSNENACKEEHATNLVKDNINYLAFEDQDKGDWDINDLILYVEPQQKVIDKPNEAKKDSVINETPSPIVIPSTVDKIVHGKDSTNNIDIEARYDGKGHDYVRIALPLKNNEEVELDIDQMNQYCQADDFRIVTKDDVEVIYCPNSSTKEVEYGKSHVTTKNDCFDTYYTNITACVTGTDEDGVYQLKLDLYPKDEDSFNSVVKLIDNKEWDKLFALKKREK